MRTYFEGPRHSGASDGIRARDVQIHSLISHSDCKKHQSIHGQIPDESEEIRNPEASSETDLEEAGHGENKGEG